MQASNFIKYEFFHRFFGGVQKQSPGGVRKNASQENCPLGKLFH